MTEGTVTRWLKQVGDQVAADESLLEVSTDKVDTEIPSPAAGTLLEIKVNEDETVDVGAELAVIGSGEAPAQAEQQAPPARRSPLRRSPRRRNPRRSSAPSSRRTCRPSPSNRPRKPRPSSGTGRAAGGAGRAVGWP